MLNYQLEPIYENVKSYYGKARVQNFGELNDGQHLAVDNKLRLFSYETLVCYIEDGEVHLLPAWNFSATTLRHVKEFLKQQGFKADNKKQMIKDYCNY